jgi:virulence factor Mce-like protein
VTRSRTLINAVAVAGFAVMCLAAIEFLAVNVGQPTPFSNSYTVHAVFSDADGVPSAADVRMSGVDVGKVVEVSHDRRYPGETLVTLAISDGRAVPVYTDGYAKVRPKTLLGEKYIDLTVGGGDAAEAIPSGGFMPVGQAGKDVSNDEIFNAFDQTTRAQQQQVLRLLDTATQQRASDIRSILPQLQTVVANLDPLARVYERDQPEVDRIFVQLDTILATIADEHEQLAGLLSNGGSVLNAVAQRDQALLTTLSEAGRFATELNGAMAGTIDRQQQALEALYPALAPACTGTYPKTQHCGQNALLDQIVGPQPACHNRPCGIDEVFTGTLTGNINYPNDQLTVTSGTGSLITEEWDSMFSQPRSSSNSCQSQTPQSSCVNSPPRALNLVLAFHCDAITTMVSELPNGSVLSQSLQQLLQQLQQQTGHPVCP